MRDKRFANHKAPCTATWQHPLQSVLALRGCSATDLIKSSEPPKAPMDKIFIDYLGPLPRSKAGNTYMIVGVDAFSKYVWLSPVREATTTQAVKFLKTIFSSFGIPRNLVSDNAKQFTSKKFHKFCFDSGINHFTSTPYYPNPFMAERILRNVVSALKAYHHDSQTLRDTNIHWLQTAFNMAKHEAHKQTINFLLVKEI